MRLINMRKAAVLAMLFTCVLGPSRAGAQLLVNGNFEAGPAIPPIQALLAVGVGGTALPGWSVVGGAVTIVTDNYWVPLSGARSVVLAPLALKSSECCAHAMSQCQAGVLSNV